MENSKALQDEILALKKEKNALVLAHYYVPLEVQDVADFVCDSFEMAKRAAAAENDLIVICGVRFMGESAKLLSPGKTVLLPVPDAGCPMADMVTPEAIRALREAHPGAAVMCYVNSSAAAKAESDICCTSSSALRVARSLEEDEVIFVPDRHLGSYTARMVPEKTFFVHDGFCPVHHAVTAAEVEAVKAAHPGAVFAVHPECGDDVLAIADFIGSTSEILQFAGETEAADIIIGTEEEIVRRLARQYPDKRFWSAKENFTCTNMKKITLEALRDCLKLGQHEVVLTEEETAAAKKSLDRMVKV